MLQSAREKKGVDLYRAERDTKIRAKHLAALESGDYAELPGSVYTKGFLRNYALYLGLDPEELLARWRDEQDYGRRGEPVAVTPPPQPIAEPRRGLTFTPRIVVAAVLSVVVLLFAGYVGLQLIRFTQVPAITIEGDRVIRLAEDATTVILRGTAGSRAVITISGPDQRVVQTATADEAGAWVTELGVSKGRNDFTLVARDPDTGRESAPLGLSAIVPVPATPTPDAVISPTATPDPDATPTPPPTPAPTLAPGATPTPTPDPTPTPQATAAPVEGVATVAIAAPEAGAVVENDLVTVSGTSDAGSVTIEAGWAGEGDRPRIPDPLTLRVRDGAFRGQLSLPEGAWAISVTTSGGDGAPVSATRDIRVRYAGTFGLVEARGGSAWIRVLVDGEIVEPGRTFRRGESATFAARRTIVVNSGNAGATYVTINGEGQGALGGAGQITTVEFAKGKEPRPLS
jgi:hypothetical protein